jgi:hypothetical protein
MKMRNQKISVGCRIPSAKVSELDTAADEIGMCRAEWIEYAIDKALGKRPRFTLSNRVAKIEQQIKGLLGG